MDVIKLGRQLDIRETIDYVHCLGVQELDFGQVIHVYMWFEGLLGRLNIQMLWGLETYTKFRDHALQQTLDCLRPFVLQLVETLRMEVDILCCILVKYFSVGVLLSNLY